MSEKIEEYPLKGHFSGVLNELRYYVSNGRMLEIYRNMLIQDLIDFDNGILPVEEVERGVFHKKEIGK